MDENQYWVAVWKIVGACFCVLVTSVAGYNMNQNYKIAEAIKDGADPIKVSCAIAGITTTTAPVCTLAANK